MHALRNVCPWGGAWPPPPPPRSAPVDPNLNTILVLWSHSFFNLLPLLARWCLCSECRGRTWPTNPKLALATILWLQGEVGSCHDPITCIHPPPIYKKFLALKRPAAGYKLLYIICVCVCVCECVCSVTL